MSEFKGIPVVPGVKTAASSGEKYQTAQGFTAIRDGIKAAAVERARDTCGPQAQLAAGTDAGGSRLRNGQADRA